MDRELEHLLELSQRLLQQAEAGEWQDVQQIEQQRRPLIHSYFESRPAATLPESDRERVREIIDLDRQVQHLAVACKDEISRHLKQLHQGRSAVAAYDANRQR